MNTVQVKLPRWLGIYSAETTSWPARAKPSADARVKGFEFSAEDAARFIHIVSECGRIRTHYDIYRWLSGELQHFLPHHILLSAWGDFAAFDLKLDLTSGIPGVRTAQLAHCRVDRLVRKAYTRWIEAGRKPVLVEPTGVDLAQPCHCAIHTALRDMRAVLVHGVHDKRSGRDSLFIMFGTAPFTKGRSEQRFLSCLDPLFAQIDAAFRKVPVYSLPASHDGVNVLELSARELDVLEAITKGKTNLDIATALDISPFTVKNHVQRIFRKIGVTNRTQAAARYAEAVRKLAQGAAANAEPAAQTGSMSVAFAQPSAAYAPAGA